MVVIIMDLVFSGAHNVISSSFPNKTSTHFQILYSLSLIFRGNYPISQAPNCEMAAKSQKAISVEHNSSCPFRCPNLYWDLAGVVKFKKTTVMGGTSQVGKNARNCFISYCFKEAIYLRAIRSAKDSLLSVGSNSLPSPSSNTPHIRGP